jgi:gliding motility-associated-like protein
LLFSSFSFSQLVVSTAMTPQQMVQNVLLGSGVTVSNVTYTGAANTIGTFTGGSGTNLGISDGIIMSSGYVNGGGLTQIGSPASDFLSDMTGGGSDPQLEAIVGNSVNDASVLAFDFTPLSDTIKFRYVFGSEEYPEFVGTSFNDVFGFFVSGPNPLGGYYADKNIALIPGTTTAIAINNINIGSFSQYFVDNEAMSGQTIVFDGFTTVLKAWCKVTPCVQYHIKLAVGDVSDQSYDSGVFLEANSFTSSAVTITTNYSTPSAGTDAIEGCNNAIINFSIPNVLGSNYIINYTVAGTATNGVDYPNIGNSITIPAGQTSASVTIAPITDGITEGPETVTLTVQTSTCGGSQTVSVNIIDNTPLNLVTSGNTSICGGSANISVTATGGIQPYIYAWNNGAGNASSAVVSPLTGTTYIISVTDVCNALAVDSVIVSVGTGSATAGIDTTICFGQSVVLTASGGTTYSWSNGQNTPSITVSPGTTTTYTVTVSTGLCTAMDDVIVNVNPLPVVTATASPSVIDMGLSSNLTATGGTIYHWTSSPVDPSLVGQQNSDNAIVTPGITTTYMVTGTDANGCSNTDTAVVIVKPVLPIIIFSADPYQGCEPLLVQFTDSSQRVSPYATYYWQFGNGTFSFDRNPMAYYQNPGYYSVSLTIINPGSPPVTLTRNQMITVFPKPIAFFNTAPENFTDVLQPEINFFDASVGNIAKWSWDFGDGDTSNSKNIMHLYPDEEADTGSYNVQFIVTTDHGCTDTTYKTIVVRPAWTIYAPNAFTPNGDGKNEKLYIKTSGVLAEGYEIRIFNNWGQQIWLSTDIETSWDGTVKGLPAKTGVYTFMLKCLDWNKIEHKAKGSFVLYY